MSIIRKQNYSFQQPVFQDGDILDECNCSQRIAGTPFGAPNMQYVECNLVNCNIGGGAAYDCNESQIDFCYWLNPDMGLPVEPENCRHVVDIDTVTIDGQTETFYEREDTVL